MHKSTRVSLIALLVAAAPAFAQFEGVLEMKTTFVGKGGQGGGSGTMTIAVANAGIRSEMNMKFGQADVKMVILQKTNSPEMLYRINDADKTYAEIDFAKLREMASPQEKVPEYSVEKLGQESLLGYKTQHLLVKEKIPGNTNSVNMELWTAKDLLDYATFSKLQARPDRAARNEALLKALKAADADGMPIKAINTGSDGSKTIIEVVKADKKSLPAATFEIPAGYTKSADGIMGLMRGGSVPQADAAQKKMGNAGKNMTPEQRQTLEKMMKDRKAGNQ
jgi:hypothetical protein